jgi:hypothetical protein
MTPNDRAGFMFCLRLIVGAALMFAFFIGAAA